MNCIDINFFQNFFLFSLLTGCTIFVSVYVFKRIYSQSTSDRYQREHFFLYTRLMSLNCELKKAALSFSSKFLVNFFFATAVLKEKIF